jgi:hypothetical protein
MKVQNQIVNHKNQEEQASEETITNPLTEKEEEERINKIAYIFNLLRHQKYLIRTTLTFEFRLLSNLSTSFNRFFLTAILTGQILSNQNKKTNYNNIYYAVMKNYTKYLYIKTTQKPIYRISRRLIV